MNLYGLFILGVNIKYIVISILYRHINVPMALKELIISCLQKEKHFYYLPPLSWYRSDATDVLELNPPGKTVLKVLALAEMSQNSYLLGIISVALNLSRPSSYAYMQVFITIFQSNFDEVVFVESA